jgi:low affinity Fe/Cu permease
MVIQEEVTLNRSVGNVSKIFSDIAKVISTAVGRPWGFLLAAAAVILWGITGPIFNFSDTWQLVINTTSSIVTFLMVFLIQNAQNRDSAAIQVKLDELIRGSSARGVHRCGSSASVERRGQGADCHRETKFGD